MATEYKVTVDTSVQSNNSTGALERTWREMSAAGWSLSHVTSFVDTTPEITPTSRIYLFWEREAVSQA